MPESHRGVPADVDLCRGVKGVGASAFGAGFFPSTASAAGAHTRDFVGLIARILKRSRDITTGLGTFVAERIYLYAVPRQTGSLR